MCTVELDYCDDGTWSAATAAHSSSINDAGDHCKQAVATWLALAAGPGTRLPPVDGRAS
jgi:hypothetical protein